MMKKILLFLLLFMILGGCTLPNSNTLKEFATAENKLPSNAEDLIFWKNETKEYLEEFYNSSILDIKETNDNIIFTFDKYSNSEQLKIESIVYFKKYPDYKITNYSKWFEGTIPVEIEMVENTDIDISLNYDVDTDAVVKQKLQIVSYFSNFNKWEANVQVGRIEFWYYQTCTQEFKVYRYDNIPNEKEDNCYCNGLYLSAYSCSFAYIFDRTQIYATRDGSFRVAKQKQSNDFVG